MSLISQNGNNYSLIYSFIKSYGRHLRIEMIKYCYTCDSRFLNKNNWYVILKVSKDWPSVNKNKQKIIIIIIYPDNDLKPRNISCFRVVYYVFYHCIFVSNRVCHCWWIFSNAPSNPVSKANVIIIVEFLLFLYQHALLLTEF